MNLVQHTLHHMCVNPARRVVYIAHFNSKLDMGETPKNQLPFWYFVSKAVRYHQIIFTLYQVNSSFLNQALSYYPEIILHYVKL